MRLPLLLAAILAPVVAFAQPAPAPTDRVGQWWADVLTLSDDAMEGRGTGTAGHQRAVDFVVGRLQALGLEPAGTEGFLQPVGLTRQVIDLPASRGTLAFPGAATAVTLPQDLIVYTSGAPTPAEVDAPLVFVGYGLHIPEAGHDDLAGLDLQGKIAVYLEGAPTGLPPTSLSNAQGARARILSQRGAVGAIALVPPGQLAVPWESLAGRLGGRTTFLAEPEARTVRRPFMQGLWNPDSAARLFVGAARSFEAVAAASMTGQPVRGFALPGRLRARIAATSETIVSPNIVARLPGSDPALAAEHVVLTAHLDHLGIGQPVNGDAINNGTLDNAAGSAALIDIAGQLRTRRPRRSILFVFVTAEELGLLGSRYFVRRPSVPRESIVANLNYDMALPLFPLRSVTVIGADQSSLGASAEAVGQGMGLPLAPDPFPERNSFIRSDHYSFVEVGIPAVAFKFGFQAGTPEAQTEADWRRRIYHSPADGPSQTVFREDEIRLHDFIAALALRVANDDARPRWNEDSPFRPR